MSTKNRIAAAVLMIFLFPAGHGCTTKGNAAADDGQKDRQAYLTAVQLVEAEQKELDRLNANDSARSVRAKAKIDPLLNELIKMAAPENYKPEHKAEFDQKTKQYEDLQKAIITERDAAKSAIEQQQFRVDRAKQQRDDAERAMQKSTASN